MSIPVTKQVTVINAIYLEETESFLILGECENGRLTPQIHRRALLPNFNFDQMSKTITDEELDAEMNNFATMIIGRKIDMVFDPDGSIRY
jgi:hypothetical protein